MRPNVDKCTFVAPEVTYLGYRIDKEGLHAVNEKVQAIAMAPAPQNCKELRSYLGCLNYYGRFINKMAGLIGSIGPYVDSEGWDSYVERLNLYFDVNDINEGKRLPAFLSIIGSNTCGVLKSLVSPTPPSGHTLQQCIGALRGHYCPKPLVIVERFRFMKRVQLEGETIQLYNAEFNPLEPNILNWSISWFPTTLGQIVPNMSVSTLQV